MHLLPILPAFYLVMFTWHGIKFTVSSCCLTQNVTFSYFEIDIFLRLKYMIVNLSYASCRFK